MKARHAFIARNALRWLIAAAALGGLQVAHAINKGQMGQFRYTPSGNSVSIKPNQAGSSGTPASVGSIPPGQVGSQIGQTGWYVGASGSGNPSGSGTMNMSHNGDVFFSGTKYPFQAGYKVPTQSVIEALGMLCKNPIICIGLSAASPAITRWLSDGKVGINGNEADYPEKPFTLEKTGKGCPTQLPAGTYQHMGCGDYKGAGPFWRQHTDYPGQCTMWNRCEVLGEVGPLGSTPVIDQNEGRMPASLDDIAPYMTPRDVPSDVVRDLLDKGADITLPNAPTVTGPQTVQGPKEVTKNPDGSTTTRQTTYNFRTDGNRITNTNTVTVTQTCTGDGSCSPATTTTTEDPKEPEQSDCEKNPDATRCQDFDLDTPDGEIPKADKNVTYQIEDSWGGGSCPANIFGTINGQSVMLYDWGQTCGYVATYLRPLLLLTCALAALFIVMPGKADA